MIISDAKIILNACLTTVRSYFVIRGASVMSCGDDTGKYSVAYVTVPNTDVGRTIARGLVQEKLAACVNIMPKIMSIYYWDNKINEDEESLLMIKTRTSEMERVINYVKSNHPYEVCEVISTPITQGNPDYLQWIGKNVPES